MLVTRASGKPALGHGASPRLRRSWTTAVAVAALALGAVSCSADEAAPATSPMLLLIKDKSLRVPDSECSGVIPLNYLHNGADYRVKDSSGKVLGTGKLPPGKAIPALDVDFGKAARIPTFCSMSFQLPVGTVGDGLSLLIEDAAPIALKVATDPAGFTASIPDNDDAASIPLGDLGGGR